MQAYELHEIKQAHQANGQLWHEFLRVPDLSMGLYVLPAGGTDPQQPHTEDEVYYVVSGRGQIMVDGEDRPVQAGSIVYVIKGIEHRFHSIEEELQILVFFAPAEGSQV
ncbi:MAG TPA: cupin domain-containing protein [Caldilineaceae bacterium]|nr:cupin domain-containing protein [Caldilineaceae bacterium]